METKLVAGGKYVAKDKNYSHHILVGASMVEITPPLEAGILMSAVEGRWAPFEGVREPLYARAVVIEQGSRRVALVSLDLLGVSGKALGGRVRFKGRVVAAAQYAVKASHLILAATHTHSAPESVAITDLYHTHVFKDWVNDLAQKVGTTIQQAAQAIRPCRLLAGARPVPGLSIYRRIKTTEGIVLSHPPPPPEKIISAEGPVDDSVNVLAFVDGLDQYVALVVNATCHPVHEMCIPQISPDYPGEMSRLLERHYQGTVALFLNGAAGNINPPTVSGGPAEAIRHGQRLAEAVEGMLGQLRPLLGEGLKLQRRPITLPARTLTGRPAAQPLKTELAALRLGETTFLFAPGELFVEIGLAIRQNSPYPFTVIAGYAEDAIGYIPTDQTFDEGGYELGPGLWARVGRGSGEIVQREALALLNDIKV
jgi:hypothetical protein